MNVRDDQRERVTASLAAHLVATGLGQTSLRQLAAAAGISDRMLLYYFADKAEVLAAALGAAAATLSEALEQALPDHARLPAMDLAARAGALVVSQDFRPLMRLWIEVVGAAAKGEQPYAEIAGEITRGFLTWIDRRLDLPDGADREGMAAAILALVDGLALVDIGAGEAMASRAAAVLATPPG